MKSSILLPGDSTLRAVPRQIAREKAREKARQRQERLERLERENDALRTVVLAPTAAPTAVSEPCQPRSKSAPTRAIEYVGSWIGLLQPAPAVAPQQAGAETLPASAATAQVSAAAGPGSAEQGIAAGVPSAAALTISATTPAAAPPTTTAASRARLDFLLSSTFPLQLPSVPHPPASTTLATMGPLPPTAPRTFTAVPTNLTLPAAPAASSIASSPQSLAPMISAATSHVPTGPASSPIATFGQPATAAAATCVTHAALACNTLVGTRDRPKRKFKD